MKNGGTLVINYYSNNGNDALGKKHVQIVIMGGADRWSDPYFIAMSILVGLVHTETI